jgi:hypothetical protein
VFWALDRFSREGMVPTIHHLERLNSYGVTFHSYTEPHLRADNEMVRGILLAVLATMAKQEAKRLSERVIAGIRKAAAKGTKSSKPIGRPQVMPTERAIRRLLQGGMGINKLRPWRRGCYRSVGSGLKWALSKARPRRDAAVSSLTNGLNISCDGLHQRSAGRRFKPRAWQFRPRAAGGHRAALDGRWRVFLPMGFVEFSVHGGLLPCHASVTFSQ